METGQTAGSEGAKLALMAEAPVGRGSAGRPEWTGQGLSRRTGVNDLTPAQKLQKQIDEKYAAIPRLKFEN